MIKNVRIGQKVWYNSSFVAVNAGIIRDIHSTGVTVVGTDGTHGTQSVAIADCYVTKEELLAALKESHDNLVREYCDSIKTVEDLVRFCYDHNMCAEEYTEYEAKEAANIRAKTLLGISLE